jgi:hypothetical protein
MNVVTFKEFNVENCIAFVIKSVGHFVDRLVSLYRPLLSWIEVSRQCHASVAWISHVELFKN